MGDIIKRRIAMHTMIAISLFLLMAFFSSYILLHWYFEQINERQLRIDLNHIVSTLEESESGIDQRTLFPSIPFFFVSTDRSVIYQQDTGYEIGDTVDLHLLGSTNKVIYQVPILKQGIQIGTLVVNANQVHYPIEKKPVLIVLLIIISVLILGVYVLTAMFRMIKKDVIYPLTQIHMTTNAMSEGNFEVAVTYDFEGEIGLLCHDFEKMREELLNSHKREQRLKEDEKILLASISHDLKTPLSSITGHVEGILLDVVTDEVEIKRYAQIIMNKASVLNVMIDDIMKHTKSELYQLSIELKETYTGVFFEEVVKELSDDAKQKGFDVKCNKIPNVILQMDKIRISEVLHNLLANSMKYGKKDGCITLIFQLLEGKEKQFHITFKDDGYGIAASDLPFVFDKFFRGDKSRTQNIPGSGLGLSISKYIIEKHGGKIECDSILDYGTEINFFIPY